MARQIEGDQAVTFREGSMQLVTENLAAERIAVDQEHRHAALATLLHRQGAVRRDNGMLASAHWISRLAQIRDWTAIVGRKQQGPIFLGSGNCTGTIPAIVR